MIWLPEQRESARKDKMGKEKRKPQICIKFVCDEAKNLHFNLQQAAQTLLQVLKDCGRTLIRLYHVCVSFSVAFASLVSSCNSFSCRFLPILLLFHFYCFRHVFSIFSCCPITKVCSFFTICCVLVFVLFAYASCCILYFFLISFFLCFCF